MHKFLLPVSLAVAAVVSACNGGLSKSEAETIADRIYTQEMDSMKNVLAKEWRDSVLVNGTDSMRFSYFVYGDKPEGGRSLYISMHGGGGVAPEVTARQWANQKRLWKPAEGVYFVPRTPHGAWNMWHQAYMDVFVDKIIAGGVLFEDVNPDKVYVMGYSAGGDGTFQLAPRLADHWAAATMMAGHPGDAQALSLRNLPFAIYMGGLDSAYNRNGLAKQWGENLDKLAQEDPDGYIHEVHIYEDLGHWMERRDTISLPWMASFARNPLPDKVVWVQDDVLRDRFYWLEVDKTNAKQGEKIVAAYSPGTVEIMEADPATIIIGLNDNMMDLDKPVTVVRDGKTIFEGKVHRSESNIAASIRGRLDPAYVFPVRLKIERETVTEL